MNRLQPTLLAFLAFIGAALANPGINREFGVIDNSDDMRTIPVKQVAAIAKEVGYQSIAVSTEKPEFIERMDAFQKAGLRVGGVSLAWTTDGKSDEFNIPFDLVLSKVRGTGALLMFAIAVKDGAQVSEERIVEQLKVRAKQAEKAGVTLAIYPHIGFRVSRFDHAHRVADAVNHPALGICFVMCHYMKQSDAADLPARLRAAKNRIFTAIINGSPVGDTKKLRFDKLVLHLDEGAFDLPAFLKLLCGELQFKGPIYVQCVNIHAPTHKTLEVSHKEWQKLKKHCRVKE